MMYKVVYLPKAREDLLDIVGYMVNTLHAPKAANDLLDAIEKSIDMLRRFPFSCRVYIAKRQLRDEYRLLVVKNYAIFYVVVEDAIEIRRVLYAKSDLKNKLR